MDNVDKLVKYGGLFCVLNVALDVVEAICAGPTSHHDMVDISRINPKW